MAYKAKTHIQHGVDGDVLHLEEGDALPNGAFSQEHISNLLEAGAIEGDDEDFQFEGDVDDDDDEEDEEPNLDDLTGADGKDKD